MTPDPGPTGAPSAAPTADPEHGVWMTHGELAEVRQISKATALRLVRRKRWPKQASNHGPPLVLVPPEYARPTDKPTAADKRAADQPTAEPRDTPPDVLALVRVSEKALAALTDALAEERSLRTSLRADLDSARAERDAAQGEAKRLGEVAAALRARLDALEKAATRAGWRRWWPWA